MAIPAVAEEQLPTVASGKPVLRVQPIQLQPNLLPNASFEEVDGDHPRQWHWNRRNTEAKLVLDETTAHTGQRSIRVTNSTPFGPHVYAMLSLPEGIEVQPSTTYTFSCYVKSDAEIGIAWFGGGTEWRVRGLFPRHSHGQWVRVVLPFTTGPEDRRIPVMLNTESPTEGFWVDDVQLVAGAQPMPVFDASSPTPVLQIELPPPATVRFRGTTITAAWNPARFPPGQYAFAAEGLWVHGLLHLPQALPDAKLSARLAIPGGAVVAEPSQRGSLPAGTYQLTAGFWAADVQGPEVQVALQLKDESPGAAKPLAASVSVQRKLVTIAIVNAALERVDQLRRELQGRVDSLRQSGRDPAYVLVVLTVLENFLEFARQDVAHEELARAYDAALEMQTLAQEALAREFLPPVPRYVTAPQRPSFRLDGPAQLGTVRWPDGKVSNDRPVQFVGVGHFGQVQRDIEKLPGYGMNIIQVEFGPNSVLVGEEEVSTGVIDEYLKQLDRAAKAGVAVNLLISPHYFPKWALEKWPHLANAHGGFLGFDVHAPEARAVQEKFLRTAIPKICRHPALHSICLSNEPIFTDAEKSEPVRVKWHAWLRARHGTIATLNERWGSDYADFDAIPVPPPRFEPTPIVYDFTTFNCEAFAEWHAWMASIVRELAPDVPLHAKIMICAVLDRHAHGPWSVSPQWFAELSDYNGNDAWKNYSPGGLWANGWLTEQMGYDFQRSMADKPVFNSENHLIPDRNTDYVPPAHIANVFWQGAVHGQSSTTTWVWERCFDYVSDTSGSILHRPACTEAMGRTGLDLMRLAPEVTALQKAPAQVALVWSHASLVAGQDYLTMLQRTYEGLNFCGLRIGLITEQQLADYAQTGKLPEPLKQLKVIAAPAVNRTPASTLAALEKFQDQGGTVLAIGDCFTQDEYGKARKEVPSIGTAVEAFSDGKAAFEVCRQQLPQWSIPRPVEVVFDDGQPCWGIEYLAVEHEGRLLVNLSNCYHDAKKVQTLVAGKPVGGTDLRSGRTFQSSVEVPSLEPVLLEIRD
jgi:hypothetical protein